MITGHPWTSEADAAARLCREAGALVLDARARGLERSTKADATIVTNADLAADRHIVSGLRALFPRDGIVTEESGGVDPASSGRTWVVDPLDGTKGFARGGPGFCVMIGLLEGATPVIGAIYLPVDDALILAVRGRGCVVADGGGIREARVSRSAVWGSLRLVVSESLPPSRRDQVLAATGLARGPAIHSVGVKVSLLVRSQGDVYYNHHGLSTWDTVAPGLALEEAGGVITTLDGAPLTYDPATLTTARFGRTLASNGARHDELLACFSGLVAQHVR